MVNKATENQIQNFENAIVSTYSSSVSYSSSVIKSISKIIGRVRNIMPKALVLVVVLLVIDAIAIIVLNIKNMRNIFRIAAIIAFTIAGLSLVGIALEKHFLGIQSLTVLNENTSIIVQIFVKEIYRILYVATSCGTIIGIISSCVCANNKQIAKKWSKTIASICYFIYNTFDKLNSKEKRSNYGRTRFKPNDFIVLA